jgi:uncharacterized membrane protein
MEWLLILALALWVWRQGRRIDALNRKLDALELRAFAAAPAPETQPAPDDVLVLDTPLPVASNDDLSQPAPEPAAQEEAPALVLVEPAPPEQEDVLVLTETLPPPEAVAPRVREHKLEQWLAENGLAWMGGGAFALGGVMLVAIAVQQSWFTPLVRLYCALALGAGLIGASEWVRRKPGAHALVAALLAGAGVATFYTAAWGAHALYNYIDAAAATLALALCALLLLGLSFRHGQALAVLAILAAFMAPALTDASGWPSLAMTLYLGAAAAAGFGVAALQRWAWAGVVTLLGLYFWFAASIGIDNVRRALALASFASLGGVAIAFRKPLAESEGGQLLWARAHALAPSIAICLSSVALIWTWLAVAEAADGVVSGPAWVGAMFVALAAAAVRARVAPAAVVAVAVAALAAGFMAYLAARYHPLEAQFYPFILFAAGVVIASAIGARPHRRDRALIAIAGGAGAALLTALGAFTADDWRAPMAYAPLFAAAAALIGAAWLQARQALTPNANLAVDAWVCAGAAMILLGVESLFAGDVRAAAHASVALGFAAAFMWRGWRGFGWSALAGATLTLAHAFVGDLAGASLSIAAPIGRTLTVLALAAGFLFGGAYVCARRAKPSPTGEALGAAAIVLVLLGAFLGLRWIAAGGVGAPLDSFTESALRGLALLAAAHIASPRADQTVGRIAALRGHVLMALGFLIIALTNGMALNPWWGAQPALITGPPVLNALALAFAAPSAFLLVAARRLYARQLVPARLCAGAGGALALLWALLEIRRAFSGATMTGGHVGALEGACYGLLFLGAALIVALLARLREGAVGADLRAIRSGAAWAGLIIGGWLLLVAHQVWWVGGADGALTGLLLALTLFVAMVLALTLGRLLSVSRDVDPTRFAAAAAAILFAWNCGHGAIRAAMDGAAARSGLESLVHALWPLALVLIGAALTRRAPGRDTIRHYLYDLQAIWANAAWPAAGVAALGLWLVFNPWWGALGADTRTPAASIAAIALCGAAAWMTLQAARVPHLRKPEWYAPAARVAAAAHLLAGVTLTVRAVFHDGVLAAGAAEGAELWTYSAAWALFGAGALAYGAMRDDAVLRWCGLAILFTTAAKVFALDTARLSGIIRVASLLGLAAVATLTALAMRRFRARGS